MQDKREAEQPTKQQTQRMWQGNSPNQILPVGRDSQDVAWQDLSHLLNSTRLPLGHTQKGFGARDPHNS